MNARDVAGSARQFPRHPLSRRFPSGGLLARARVGAWDVRSLVAMSPRGDRGGWWWRFGEERRFRPLARSGSGPRVVRDRIHGRLDASLAPDGPRPGRAHPRRHDVRRDPRRTYRGRSRGGDASPPSRPTPSRPEGSRRAIPAPTRRDGILRPLRPSLARRSRRTTLPPLEDHADYVFAAAFTPDGEWIVTGGADGRVCAWRASDADANANANANAAPPKPDDDAPPSKTDPYPRPSSRHARARARR